MAVIRRKITLTACNGQHVNVKTNEFEDFCDVLVGEFDCIRASKKLRKTHNDASIVINNVQTTTETYEIDALKFIANAKRVN